MMSFFIRREKTRAYYRYKQTFYVFTTVRTFSPSWRQIEDDIEAATNF